MAKYFALFNIPAATMQDWMANTDEATRKEQMDKMMQDWNDWMEAHSGDIVEKGLPLGKTKRVTANGVMDAKNDMNWYMIVEADSPEAAAELFSDSPHLQIPDAYIDVMGTEGMPSM